LIEILRFLQPVTP